MAGVVGLAALAVRAVLTELRALAESESLLQEAVAS
jgi:hypothetical protein